MQANDDDTVNIAQRHRFARFGLTASDTCGPRPLLIERTAHTCRPPEQFDAPQAEPCRCTTWCRSGPMHPPPPPGQFCRLHRLQQRAHDTRRRSRIADTVARLVLWLVLVLLAAVVLLPFILEAAP
jgi:hypothetical protein